MHHNTNYYKNGNHNETGSVLLISVLILLLLTVLGVSAMNMTQTEYQITQNYQIYNKNLYNADAAVREASQRFENVSGHLTNGKFGSINDDDATVDSNATQSSTWSSNAISASISDGRYMWCPRKVSAGKSLSLAKSTPHDYFLYGRGEANDGEVIVKIGYRKAF